MFFEQMTLLRKIYPLEIFTYIPQKHCLYLQKYWEKLIYLYIANEIGHVIFIQQILYSREKDPNVLSWKAFQNMF